eukprot:GHVS01072407.1.p1 GENE.GHVS01072407.1~~GHVS01072407.1.p1  ORF type:complete len:598 (+),score=69.36 GHVS01072407.1:47-1840(+)
MGPIMLLLFLLSLTYCPSHVIAGPSLSSSLLSSVFGFHPSSPLDASSTSPSSILHVLTRGVVAPSAPPTVYSSPRQAPDASGASIGSDEYIVTLPDGRSVSVPQAAMQQMATFSEEQREDLEEILVSRMFTESYPIISAGEQQSAESFSVLKDNLHALIDSAVRNHQTDYVFPLKEIVNATLEGGLYPTVVPGQAGPLPNKNEVYCNPALMPCASLGDWGRSIGIPLRHAFVNSVMGKSIETVGDGLNRQEEKLTAGITPTAINFIEQDTTVATLEVLAATLSPILTFKKDDPLWLTARNITETVVWQPLDFVDPPNQVQQINSLAKAKVAAARMCRLFNGRLPNCGIGQEVNVPGIPVKPSRPVIDPVTGFIKFIFIWGFEASCRYQGSCVSGTPSLQPENFDGVYILNGVSPLGQPVYTKADFFFKDFNSVRELFFWQATVRFSNPIVFPNLATWAAITPTVPSYDAVVRGSRPPFSFVLPGENSGGSPPSPCTNTIGRNGNFATTFPLCLNFSDKWRFGRANASGCNGIRINSLCYFPVLNKVFPVESANPPTVDGGVWRPSIGALGEQAQSRSSSFLSISSVMPPGIGMWPRV